MVSFENSLLFTNSQKDIQPVVHLFFRFGFLLPHLGGRGYRVPKVLCLAITWSLISFTCYKGHLTLALPVGPSGYFPFAASLGEIECET